jgi:type VI protein secretion system component VasK
MPRLRILVPWLLAALALAWAVAPYVPRDRFTALAPIAGLATATFLIAIGLVLYLRRRRQRAPLPDPQRERAARRRRTLLRTCAAARKLRPTHIWLCLGAPRHGKTALLAATSAQRELIGEATSTPELPTFQLSQPGRELLLEHPGNACDLTPLRRLRGRQPIDAILLTLALPELLVGDLPVLATTLRRQLVTSLADLAVDVPVYLVCTKLDRLAGHLEIDPGDAPWGFELAARDDLPRLLRRWTDWVATRRLTRLATDPDPERRARLFTFAEQFSRACERLTALADDLFAPLPGLAPRLRGVYFTAARPDPIPPADQLLLSLATTLHTRLRPEPVQPAQPTASSHTTSSPPTPSSHTTSSPPTASSHTTSSPPTPSPAPDHPRPTDLTPLLATLRRRAGEATRSPAHRHRRQHRGLAFALAITTLALALAITAVDAARGLHLRLQAVADLGATLGAIEAAPPLLALRAELDAWRLPPGPGLTRILSPELGQSLRATYQRWARERLLRPLWRALERRLQRGLIAATAGPELHGLLRAYLLLTVSEDMSHEPDHGDPAQREWLLAELPRLAEPPQLADSRLLATLFGLAPANELRFPRDHALVERVRVHLRALDDDELLLQAALRSATSRCEPLTLAAISHADQLSAERAIPCSFTRDSWPHVQEQLVRAAGHGDDWVLGRAALPHADADRLARLRSRHDTLYIAAWTDFLHGLRVRRPGDLAGVSRLLTELTGEAPPLGKIFQALDHHTRGLQHLGPGERSLVQLFGDTGLQDRSAPLARAFAPLLHFAIATPERQAGLDRYHARLTELRDALEAARRDPADLPALHEHLATALTDTHALLLQPDLRRFRPLLSALLLPPLTTLQTALREQDKLALTRAYCQEIHAPLRALVARYPFTIGAHDELSLAEFTAFFHPDTGALRRFRDAHLAPLIVIHGQGFTPRPTPRTDEHPLSPAVLALLHRAALLGELAFPAGTLGLDLELELHCNADIGRVTFTLDGASHSYTCGPGPRHHMRWPGPADPRGASLELTGRDGRHETIPGHGPWGLWRLLEKDGLVGPPDDTSHARLVFHLDLRASRLGTLDLALTTARVHGASLLHGLPGGPTLLAPLRAHELLEPPAALFIGLPGCADLPSTAE